VGAHRLAHLERLARRGRGAGVGDAHQRPGAVAGRDAPLAGAARRAHPAAAAVGVGLGAGLHPVGAGGVGPTSCRTAGPGPVGRLAGPVAVGGGGAVAAAAVGVAPPAVLDPVGAGGVDAHPHLAHAAHAVAAAAAGMAIGALGAAAAAVDVALAAVLHLVGAG